ncbi:AmmeMemoRadiSam system radical SAM enzyme [Thermocladium modestius]|uniref:AmmeMemoRadiSam system radical SAM enzyme n=1 Tax=Thermocladium modestius TaxID=62609 RepID=UPI00166A4B3C|nr:AmmeMemoRadiSam system radical SAM enzyme [Thermocladium modestius]
MKEAQLYRSLGGGVVQCTACPRRCKVSPGLWGACGIRWNIDGKLYLMNYGRIIAAHIDPIEKKPLFHFNPGSAVFSIATTGCSWFCQYCQNSDISQRRRVEGFEVTPQLLVDLASAYGAHGFAYTYNEPTIFIEFARDVGLLAHEKGLFNSFVSNGYMTDEAIEVASQFLDAVTVDLKGNANESFLRRFVGVPSPEPIFESIKALKERGIHVEITDLVVPGVGDDLGDARRVSRWIVDELGPETPVHFLRFHPDYKMMNVPPTPVETLEKHAKVAIDEGLKYVYIGNVPGHELENTRCPSCGRVIVRRWGFRILEWNIENGKCKYCGAAINIKGELKPTWREDRFVQVPIHLFSNYTEVKLSDVKGMRIIGEEA